MQINRYIDIQGTSEDTYLIQQYSAKIKGLRISMQELEQRQIQEVLQQKQTDTIDTIALYTSWVSTTLSVTDRNTILKSFVDYIVISNDTVYINYKHLF